MHALNVFLFRLIGISLFVNMNLYFPNADHPALILFCTSFSVLSFIFLLVFYLSELRFADDIALITTTVRNMEEQLNMINDESKKIGLKIHRGKTKYMTNFNTNKKIIVENTEIEKVEEYRYLGQNIEMKDVV